MSNVILDNWGLNDCMYNKFGLKNFYAFRNEYEEVYQNDNEYVELCWQNLLTSLVLWDDLHFSVSTDSPSYLWKIFQYTMEKFQDIIKDTSFLHIHDCYLMLDNDKFVANYNQIVKFYEYIVEQNQYPKTELLFRGFHYLTIANTLGYNYLPHPVRSKYIQESRIFKPQFDREVYFKKIDKDIQEYINEINELYGHNLLNTQFPVLYNFIQNNAESPSEQLSVAMSLRNNQIVKQFRNSIDKIENELNNGNLSALHESLKDTSEICKTICDNLYKRKWSFDVSLGLSPSINTTFSVQNKTPRKLHTVFLYDLANFAITGKTKHKLL